MPERCPVCGEYSDYCQGHGEIDDPIGHAVMLKHDQGDHSECAFPKEICEEG